eukprot:TRINITY_DN9943_c0_g2_i2.p2 TRINITY_DN9943_c0_g2~~TRINITY_DN9943_c0_g2_i2.p2  ORF type:complete len:133 (-),score=36.77 TRINITY_DN9943_c0_g2_i2:121-519(-)
MAIAAAPGGGTGGAGGAGGGTGTAGAGAGTGARTGTGRTGAGQPVLVGLEQEQVQQQEQGLESVETVELVDSLVNSLNLHLNLLPPLLNLQTKYELEAESMLGSEFLKNVLACTRPRARYACGDLPMKQQYD